MHSRTLATIITGLCLTFSFSAVAEDQQLEPSAPQELLYNDDYEDMDQAWLETVQHRRLWTCFSRGWSGRTFSATADNINVARRSALFRCRNSTGGCSARGCR